MKKLFLSILISLVAVAGLSGAYLGTKDPMLEIAAGNITGYSQVNKFGQNQAVAADSEEDIHDGGGVYAFPATATCTHIRSAVDSADTRGVTIEVQGLDASWALVVQTKDTDGTDSETEVALDTPLIRIFRMKVLENTVMDQDIWAGPTGFVGKCAMILAGNNQTLMAIYTIPAGKTGYITRGYASTTESTGKEPKSTEIRMWAADRANGYEFQLKRALGIPKAGSMLVMEFKPYMKLGEKTDIKVSAYCEDEIGNVSAGFDIILIDN